MAATSHDPYHFHKLPGDPLTKINREPQIDPRARYLKKLNDPSGAIYPYQGALAQEPGIVECDCLGRPVESVQPQMPYIPGADGAAANAVLAQMTNMMNQMRQQMAQMNNEQDQLRAQLALAQSQISGHDPNVKAPVAVSHVDGPAVDMPEVEDQPGVEDQPVAAEETQGILQGNSPAPEEFFQPPEGQDQAPQVTRLPDGTVQVGAQIPDEHQLRPIEDLSLEFSKDIDVMKTEFRKCAYGDFQRAADQKNALNNFVKRWFSPELRSGIDFRKSVTQIVRAVMAAHPMLSLDTASSGRDS